MKIKTLLLGTSLSLIPQFVNAQCVATTDCATLGYTETSCPNGKGIKCPFGDKWACPSSKEETCAEYGFKYDCSGTGYASGSGTPCNNKYASCTCASGYEWKDGACTKRAGAILGQCTGYAKNCKIGQILNIDGSCSDYRVSGVEPVGIVVYIGGDGCGQALALEELEEVSWSTEIIDVPNLPNYETKEDALKDFDSCKNTENIINYSKEKYGESAWKYYTAAWKAHNYAPSSITKGKWCLPAAGVLENAYKNIELINQSLIRLAEKDIGKDGWWWSSSERNEDYTWFLALPGGVWGSADPKGLLNSVIPVIEF